MVVSQLSLGFPELLCWRHQELSDRVVGGGEGIVLCEYDKRATVAGDVSHKIRACTVSFHIVVGNEVSGIA